ncbi:hypothetical protein SPRG_09134 [Saprolegnia parasitica CBS 223.65]|uniref:Uncharacterized protein n=1 Tax=Saprolegnia parasitica (strain CBS 223.65) TaxID=695850 RepID=A0A067C3G0_SAPPC|nr:hypothetical protein SPRG_09134 [Saprolegnia parasitica CBS 223.65]KDO25304.1 hypothetical protein SPRG_09134 [Saprolegnia parasitica CBS 223.65]|eukprot:XP_012203962.1 hypothetical protein SPRG_09134 [Saprolegnia parasitica CBS 223.65]
MDVLGSVKVKQVTPVSEKQAAKTLEKFLATHHDELEADKLNLQLILEHLQKQ